MIEYFDTEEEQRKLERLQDRIQSMYEALLPTMGTAKDGHIASIAADIVAIIDREAEKRLGP